MSDLNKKFYPGQIIWFYYSSIIPCQKGKIINYVKDDNFLYYNVDWIDTSSVDGHEFKSGTSGVLPEKIFETEKECRDFDRKVYNDLKNKFRRNINSKQALLQFMYNCIYSDNCDLSAEKSVIREKVQEYFGIELE